MSEGLPRPIASYEADPDQVGRVLLLYSGGLDTSVMLRWIQEHYEAEVVALTVDLGQPDEDWDVVVGKAKHLGAVEALVVDAREEFARDYVLPAIKANALYGEACGRGRTRAWLRHRRARLHGKGERPGPDRGDGRDARARAQGDRARARMADGPRGGDRVRP